MQLLIKLASLSRIFPNPSLRDRSQPEIEEMAASLNAIGQISPIGVIETDDGLKIIYGNTRFLAAKKLNWEKLEVRIYSAETTPAECMRLAVCENTVREQMNFVELADAIHEYAKLSGLTLAAAGQELNYRQSQISKCLKTDERLTTRNKKKLLEAGIGGSLAYLISQEIKQQDQLVDQVIAEKWSRKQLEQYFRRKRKGGTRFEFRRGGGKLAIEVPRAATQESILQLLKDFAATLKKNAGFDLQTAARRIKEQSHVVS